MSVSNTCESVVEIFEDLLNRDSISVDDNFFACGGSSLMAARALSLLSERYKVDLSLPTFLENPTARQLALLVETALSNKLQIGDPIDNELGYEEDVI